MDLSTIIALLSISIAAATFVLHFISTKAVVTAKKEETDRRIIVSDSLAQQLVIKFDDIKKEVELVKADIKVLNEKAVDSEVGHNVLQERLSNEIKELDKMSSKLDDIYREIKNSD